MTAPVSRNLIVELDDISADVVFKDIRHVYLRVCPPAGRVRIAAPLRTSPEFIRRFVGTKIHWIRKQQAKLLASPLDAPRPLLPAEREALRVAVRGLADGPLPARLAADPAAVEPTPGRPMTPGL